MRVALPLWNGRVSPVFDVAKRIRLYEVEKGEITGLSEHLLEEDGRSMALSSLGVDVLICAAISWPLETTLWLAGVEVIAEVCGPVDEVIGAYLRGSTALKQFHSPGHRKHDRGHFTAYLRGGRGSDSHGVASVKPSISR
jgi:predicted Fe-Mo cluster-binding NifX family protein